MHRHLPAYLFTHEYRVQVPLRFRVMLTTHLMLEQVLATYVCTYVWWHEIKEMHYCTYVYSYGTAPLQL